MRVAILKSLEKNPRAATAIAGVTNIYYQTCKEMLETLASCGAVVRTGRKYDLTELGRGALWDYEKLMKVLE